MGKNKIGRNQACWCGSGKKYKRCHWREDQARGRSGPRLAPQPRGVDVLAELSAIQADLTSPDIDRARAHIAQLQEMLRPGGNLARLRFDAERFDAAVQEHVEAIVDADTQPDLWEPARQGDDRAPWESLMDLCHRSIVGGDWPRRTRQALMSAVKGGRLNARQRQAALFGVATLGVDEGPDGVPSPLVMALFPVQLKESAEAHHLDQTLMSVAEAVRSGEVALEDGHLTFGPQWESALGLMMKQPGLRQHAEQMAAEAMAESLKILRSDRAPSLLTLDVQLLVFAVLAEAKAAGEESAPDALCDRLTAAMDPAIAPELRTRCMTAARQAQTPEETWQWGALALAVTLEPVMILLKACQHPHPHCRDPEEQAFLSRSVETTEEMVALYEDYEVFLHERGEAAAAARMTRARQLLTEHLK